MSTTGPLEGKRVVVTRAVEQSRDLVAHLENMGAIVLLFPAVSFSEPTDTTELDRAIRSLDKFDWILFTSANAARFFAGRCRNVGVDPGRCGNCLCAAVGPATASAVTAEGFPVDHVAQEFRGTELARDLSMSIAGKKILVPRSDRARPDLPNVLRAAGAEVTEVVAYHTGGASAIDPGVMRAIRAAQVDVICFFSPSSVENTRAELGEEVISRLGTKAAFAAVGPVTSAALRDAGLPVDIVAPLATAESMADAISNYFSSSADSKARAV